MEHSFGIRQAVMADLKINAETYTIYSTRNTSTIHSREPLNPQPSTPQPLNP